jgi:nucleotide-binding universal stress UspA family protein
MKVLLPIEGSEFSMAAIRKCCELFDKSENTELEIFCAAEPAFTPSESAGLAIEYMEELQADALEKAREATASAENEVRKGYPELASRLTTKVVLGPAKRVIVEEAEDWGADLIVMGTHGYGFWKRAMLGSVSNSVVHHAPCSVLVVRPPQIQNGTHWGRSVYEEDVSKNGG